MEMSDPTKGLTLGSSTVCFLEAIFAHICEFVFITWSCFWLMKLILVPTWLEI